MDKVGISLRYAEYVTLLCTALLVISIYIKYDIELQIDINSNRLSKYDHLLTTGRSKFMILEICLASLAPTPLFNK